MTKAPSYGYQILVKGHAPIVLNIPDQQQAMSLWDEFVRSANTGDKLVLKSPEGNVVSEYFCARRNHEH